MIVHSPLLAVERRKGGKEAREEEDKQTDGQTDKDGEKSNLLANIDDQVLKAAGAIIITLP